MIWITNIDNNCILKKSASPLCMCVCIYYISVWVCMVYCVCVGERIHYTTLYIYRKCSYYNSILQNYINFFLFKDLRYIIFLRITFCVQFYILKCFKRLYIDKNIMITVIKMGLTVHYFESELKPFILYCF